MSLTIEVTLIDPQRVHLRLLNPDGFNVATLIRTDANGTRTVRTLAGLLPSTAAAIDVDDFEYALAGAPVRYDVYDAGNVIRGTVSVPTGQFPHSLFLTVPLDPSSGLELAQEGNLISETTLVIDYDAARSSQSTVHEIIGRSDPVVVLRGAVSQRGTMRFVAPDHTACERLVDALALARVFMLRQTDVAGLDLYFVVENVAKRGTAERTAWEITALFAEVSWPNGAYTPITVWTYADLAAGYADYNEVAVSFVDYLHVLERSPL